jgi:hypothetical protein
MIPKIKVLDKRNQSNDLTEKKQDHSIIKMESLAITDYSISE